MLVANAQMRRERQMERGEEERSRNKRQCYGLLDAWLLDKQSNTMKWPALFYIY